MDRLEMYKIYNEAKENFVKRAFSTNRFYIVMLLLILLTVLICDQIFASNSLTITFCMTLFGMGLSLLWVANQDSYCYLTKIKLNDVLEKLEQDMEIKPYTMEHNAISEHDKTKRILVFSEIQRYFSIIVFFMFVSLFLNKLVPFVIMLFNIYA